MIPYPNETDNVVWAREGQIACLSQPDGISLYLSSLAPASELFARHIGEEFGERWQRGASGPSIWGDERLMEAVAHRDGVAPENVLITTGCTQSFDMLCRTYLRPGDEILLERPGYEVHAAIARDCGAAIRFFERTADVDGIDLDELARAITSKTKIITVTNLQNPSSGFLREAFVEKLGGLAATRGVILAVDEVYRDFLPDAQRIRVLGPLSEFIVRFDSFSKTYGIDGIACGWMIAAESVRRRLREHYSRALISVSQLSVRAASMVFDHLPEYRGHQQAVMARNLPLLEAFFATAESEELVAGTIPKAGPIAFIEAMGETDDRIWAWLAREKNLMLIPGAIYGKPGSTRIGFGGDTKQLAEGLERLLNGLREWRNRGSR